MRKKLTIAIMSAVAISVLAAGIGVLLISARINHVQSIKLLDRSSSVLAVIAAKNEAHLAQDFSTRRRFGGAEVLLISRNGQIHGHAPRDFILKVVKAEPLLALTTLQGTFRDRVYVMRPIPLVTPIDGSKVAVLLLTRTIPGSYISTLYLVLVGSLILISAYFLSAFLSNKITNSFYSLIEATKAISRGELEADIVLESGSDPEIRELAQAIEQMASDLSVAREAEQQFLLSISHDLRTPLTSIVGFSESIIDGAVDDPKRAAATILKESRRLEHLVGDLLELAKLQSSKFSLEMVTCSLNQLLEDLGGAYRRRCEELGLAFTIQLPQTPITVTTDPNRFLQVLENLVENACKFTATQVGIVAVLNPDGVSISITDDGPGLDPRDKARVFREQYRSPRVSATTKGSGLGLMIVAQLTKALGLNIGYLSPVTGDRGTEMQLVIPKALLSVTGTPQR